jgi:hypothetical protein
MREWGIRELMAEQRTRARSGNAAERFAAALVIPGVLAGRLRQLGDFNLGWLLEHEVCSNLSVLAPELTVCMEAADRLLRGRSFKLMPRRRSIASRRGEGEHILHVESALYWARIPHLLLPFQRDKFASNTFMVPSVREAKDCLRRAGFREIRQAAQHLQSFGVQAHEESEVRPRIPSGRHKHAGAGKRGGRCPLNGEED